MSVGIEDDDIFRWRICFQGPENTVFEGGLYEASLIFPDDFPYQPPKMIFRTEMFHPNSTSFSNQYIQMVKSVFRSYILQLKILSILNKNSQKNGIQS